MELTVRVTPRSSRNKVAVQEGAVRVWVTAPPTDGQANDAVRRLLAKSVGLAPSKLTLLRGETARDKVFRIEGMEADEALARIRDAMMES